VQTSTNTSPPRALARRWPAAAGLLAAVLMLAFTVDRQTVTISLTVAALCYLGAAALGRRWVAWAGVAVFSVPVVVAELIGVPWWVATAVVAAALLITGLVIGVPRPPVLAQTVAALAYGGVAVAALSLPADAGLLLAGLALAAHAGWDAVHYRRDAVVPRSLAEACMFFDVPLGVGAVVIALTG
jgi:hypothetical protein